MTYQVTIQNTGHQFPAEPGENILEAAQKAGLVLPYGCRDGACGSCKGKLISGSIDYGDYAEKALPAEDKAKGHALFCQAKPLSDVVIEAREVRSANDLPVRKLPTRVNKMERVADDVTVIFLKPPAGDRLQFLAGQYLDVLLKGGLRRSFSLGNPPHDDEALELHIRLVAGGEFTGHVFNKMKEKDILRIEAPLGTFFLREESEKPIVFVASGTGFAPIKAILQHMFHQNMTRPMVMYWGGRRPKDLYMDALCRQWAAEHAHFKYVPVISDGLAEDQWTGRTGFVHRAVMQDFPSLAGHQVYACGVPIMVDSAKKDFIQQCQLPEEEFYCDSFTTAADRAK